MPRTTKSSVLTLRISPEEQDRLRAAAEAQGVSVSEYVRSKVPSKPPAQPAPPVTGTTARRGTATTGTVVDDDGRSAQWTTGPGNSQTLTVRVTQHAPKG